MSGKLPKGAWVVKDGAILSPPESDWRVLAHTHSGTLSLTEQRNSEVTKKGETMLQERN